MRPESLSFLSGVLLVSQDPERLATFYRDVLGVPLVEERHGDAAPHWGCELGDVHFAIHSVEDYPEDPVTGTGAVKLAFMVFDLAAFAGWLEERGTQLCYQPTQLGSESLVTAVRDPDGNMIELTELGSGWLEHLKTHRADGHDLIRRWSRELDASRVDTETD